MPPYNASKICNFFPVQYNLVAHERDNIILKYIQIHDEVKIIYSKKDYNNTSFADTEKSG